MAEVGKREVRVDAFDKATGRTKYYEDLMPRDALYVRIKHSTIAHGFVKSVDKSAAEAIPGVVKVLTCFDVPEHPFPTAGHPWSMDPGHQDVADRHLLNRHVRYYGDDVAVVIAENEVAAMQGVRALQVEYEELPLVLDAQEAMKPGAPQLHEAFPNNILKHTDMKKGDYQAAIREPGLIKVEGWYDTPTVQHCHIENHGCFAYEENGRITVVASTQIPHIIRRVVGQALGCPWSDIRVVKPYIGGGFGNKQDALYEPLCAWCSTQVQGRTAPLPPERWSCSPTRGPTPPTDTASWPRPWAPSPSTIPATTWSATPGPCSPTGPPPAPCGATVCPRPPLPTRPTLMNVPPPWAWSPWNTG